MLVLKLLLCVLLVSPIFILAEEDAKSPSPKSKSKSKASATAAKKTVASGGSTASQCAKLTNTECSKSNSGCILQTGTSCSGSTAKFCSKTSCGTKGSTCGSTSGVYYSFTGTCLPSGFASAKSSKCTCASSQTSNPIKSNLTCAQLTYSQCVTFSKSCIVEIGLACNNLSFAFCRGKTTCATGSACSQEPITGLHYKFGNQCKPSGWVTFSNLTQCDCSSYTTNTCPQCPPGYSCPANSTSVSACFPIGNDNTLPSATPSFYGFEGLY